MTFLRNHLPSSAGMDFCTVPTLGFGTLYVFVILDHGRRVVRHGNVTAHPAAVWILQNLRDAFPGGEHPITRLHHDRDGVYGQRIDAWLRASGIEPMLSAYRSPWQNPFVERFFGSLRRECLDHVIPLGDEHLRRIVGAYIRYDHADRTHLGLDGDTPMPRAVEPVMLGPVIAEARVGGLHHRYRRQAA